MDIKYPSKNSIKHIHTPTIHTYIYIYVYTYTNIYKHENGELEISTHGSIQKYINVITLK